MADHDHITHLAKKWPGKSRPRIHPALWHMLDVGAVAHRMLQIQPIASEQVNQALALLAALQDMRADGMLDHNVLPKKGYPGKSER